MGGFTVIANKVPFSGKFGEDKKTAVALYNLALNDFFIID